MKRRCGGCPTSFGPTSAAALGLTSIYLSDARFNSTCAEWTIRFEPTPEVAWIDRTCSWERWRGDEFPHPMPTRVMPITATMMAKYAVFRRLTVPTSENTSIPNAGSSQPSDRYRFRECSAEFTKVRFVLPPPSSVAGENEHVYPAGSPSEHDIWITC